MAKKYLSFYK